MRSIFLKILGVGVVLLLVALAAAYWLTSASNTESYEGKRSVFIPRDASFDAVTDSLLQAGILADEMSFKLFGTATGWGNQIKAGHYTFASGRSNRQLLSTLRRGLQEPVKVVVPPGSRREVVAAVVAKYMEFDAADFLAALSNESLAEELGADTTTLFGFMMPETYSFYWLTDAETVVRKVKGYFDAFYKREYDGPPLGIDLTPAEIVSVASIVEWESSREDEKARIAGVYLNRLRDQWLLQADPTIQYALLQTEGSKRRLFFKDYNIEHPYNTYKYGGLPPGPVTNPSPSSLRAAMKPEVHRYFYFVANGDGTHTFSRTLREHTAAAARFYELQRARRASGT